MAGQFTLEVDNWGEWEQIRSFFSFEAAMRTGTDEYAQNIWRIRDAVTDAILYDRNPDYLQEIAQQELDRFSETRHWRQVFHERQRLGSITPSSRSENRARGNRISISSASQRNSRRVESNPRIGQFLWDRLFGSEPIEPKIVKEKSFKINWKKEGF